MMFEENFNLYFEDGTVRGNNPKVLESLLSLLKDKKSTFNLYIYFNNGLKLILTEFNQLKFELVFDGNRYFTGTVYEDDGLDLLLCLDLTVPIDYPFLSDNYIFDFFKIDFKEGG